jgi:hypothetical protein
MNVLAFSELVNNSRTQPNFEMQQYTIIIFLTARGRNSEDCVIYQDFGVTGTTAQRPGY